ncbi:MAG: hypothetical protein JWN67_5033 [Actinomycetia bacterium]|nr:hypothetical protein [Actinomycetes bacterium]
MTDFATTADVAGIWRPLTTEEQVVATNLLAYASVIIRARVPGIDDRIAAGTLDGALARMTAAEMVKRRLENPDGYRSEQIDDYSFTRDQEHSAGGLYLTDDEMGLLRGSRPRAFSVTPGRPEPTCTDLEQVALRRAWWGRTDRRQ